VKRYLLVALGNFYTVNPSSLIESRISASAADVRGLIIHLKGTGCLLIQKKKKKKKSDSVSVLQ
jgi:hypothetical protein